MIYLMVLLGLLTAAVSVVVIRRISRGSWFERYPWILISSVVAVWASVSNLVIYLLSIRGLIGRSAYTIAYWGSDAATHTVCLLLLASLISPGRRLLAAGKSTALTVGAVLTGLGLLVSVQAWAGTRAFNFWMTEVVRNLSFLEALLTMVLWRGLLRSGAARDPVRLLVSAAVGLQTASSALGHAMRAFGPQWVSIGNLAVVVGFLLRSIVWSFAFRKPSADPRRHTGGASTEPPAVAA